MKLDDLKARLREGMPPNPSNLSLQSARSLMQEAATAITDLEALVARTPSRNDVLEEAALIAEEQRWGIRFIPKSDELAAAQFNQAVRDIAAAIRARKDQTDG